VLKDSPGHGPAPVVQKWIHSRHGVPFPVTSTGTVLPDVFPGPEYSLSEYKKLPAISIVRWTWRLCCHVIPPILSP